MAKFPLLAGLIVSALVFPMRAVSGEKSQAPASLIEQWNAPRHSIEQWDKPIDPPITNCTQSLEQQQPGGALEDLEWNLQTDFYADCYIISAKSRRVAVQSTLFDHADLAHDLYRNFDIGSVDIGIWPPEGRDKKAMEHFTLRDMRRYYSWLRHRPVTFKSNGFEILAPKEYFFSLEVVDSGDFEGTGQEQLLATVTAQALSGHFVAVQPVILTRTDRHGMISAHQPKLLPPAGTNP